MYAIHWPSGDQRAAWSDPGFSISFFRSPDANGQNPDVRETAIVRLGRRIRCEAETGAIRRPLRVAARVVPLCETLSLFGFNVPQPKVGHFVVAVHQNRVVFELFRFLFLFRGLIYSR